MLVLEFEQSTNMDSAVVDILQKTQMLTGRWDDSIGTPSIIRINPNMIPVMVAAVDSSEMDRYELSRFAKDTVIPALEGTTGVASITTGGMIERTMTIEVNEAKLDKMNAKIAEAIDKAMEDARKQLEDAQKELDENREKVEAGTNQLLSASSGISDSIKQGEDDLADTLTAAGETAAKLASARAAIDALNARLEQAEAALAEAEARLAETDARIASLEADSALYAKALGEPYDSMDASTTLEAAGLDADTVAALNAKGCTDLGSVRTMNNLNDVNLSAQRTARAAQAVAVETARVQTEELRTQIAAAEERCAQLEEESKKQMESLENMQKQLEELPGMFPGMAFTTSVPFNIEVNSSAATKGQGLAALCRRLDIRPEEVLAFGDDRNDADMIRFAGIGVAMENAIEELRAAADWVAVSNAEAGVARGIEHFVLGSGSE